MGATHFDHNSLLYQHFPELTLPLDDPEAQYQIGVYWLKRDVMVKAERWIRYAAHQGHDEAIQLLRIGLSNTFFRDDKHHFISIAIDLLETFISPEPSQADIDILSQVLEEYIYKRYTLPNII
jgi:TPR repeat protein